VTPRFSRREFLAGAGGLAVGAAAGGLAVGASQEQAAGADSPHLEFVPFEGAHQTGITSQPVPAQGLMASFTVLATDRAHLREMFRELTDEIRGLMAGEPPEQRDSAYPPTDSGILGPTPAPDDLSVIVSVGASLFDDRYGLADRRPRELVQMPFIANDRLDPARSHGDLLLTISAEHTDHVIFALRQLMRRTRREMTLRWVIDGFSRRSDPTDRTTGSPRNLLGFVDGTANLHTDAELMDRYVWTAGGRDGEPEWTTGGSYHAVRVIRMLVEFWDRTPLAEQEALMGRRKISGAPLDGTHETDVPDYAADPRGEVTPLDAHIRLANPRTPESQENLILRRGFSYTRGYDGAGQLDQGLAFVSFQKSIATGFLAVQTRLNGEPLEEYIRPEGGGYFFALPGVPTADGYLGQGLLRG
jgi:deferrochelatase/peroxidase EfeB